MAEDKPKKKKEFNSGGAFKNYAKNLGKSVLHLGKDILLTDDDTGATALSGFLETQSDLPNIVTSNFNEKWYPGMKKFLNETVKDNFNELKKNIKDDLKSGSFYSKERENKAMGFELEDDFDFEEDFDSLEDDIDNLSENFDNFADMATSKLDDMNDNIEEGFDDLTSGLGTVASTIVSSNYKATKVNMNANLSMFKQAISVMNAIRKDTSQLVSFTDENLTPYLDEAKSYYQKSIELHEATNNSLRELIELKKKDFIENEEENERESLADKIGILESETFSLSEYASAVQKNIKEFVTSMTGVDLGDENIGASTMIKSAISNPIYNISKVALKSIIPKFYKNAVGEFNKAFSSFMPSLFLKMNSMYKDTEFKSGISNVIKRSILQFLKVPIDDSKSVNLVNYDAKKKASFDQLTRKTIIDVIPTYLSKILAALTNEDELIFDKRYGKFTTLSNAKNEYDQLDKIDFFDFNETKTLFQNNLRDQLNLTYQQTSKTMEDFNEILKSIRDNAKGVYKGTESIEDIGLNEKYENSYSLWKILFEKMDKTDKLRFEKELLNAKQNVSNRYKNSNIYDSPVLQYLMDKKQNDEKIKGISVRSSQRDNIESIRSNQEEFKVNQELINNAKNLNKLLRDGEFSSESLRLNQREKDIEKEKQKRRDEGKEFTDKDREKFIQKWEAEHDEELSDFLGDVKKDFNKNTKGFMSVIQSAVEKPFKILEKGLNTLDTWMYNIIFDEKGGLKGHLTNAFSGIKADFSKFFSNFKKELSGNLLIPLKSYANMAKIKLFGTKDEIIGNSKDGLLSNLTNTFRNWKNGAINYLFGKGYIDAKTEKYVEAKEKPLFTQIKDKFHNLTIRASGYLFGVKSDDGSEIIKEGLFSRIKNKFEDLVSRTKSYLFGGEDASGKTWEGVISKDVQEKFKKYAPATSIGSGAGGIIGGLFGGKKGAVIGAIVGGAAGFVSQVDAVKDFLWGKKNDEGKRENGIFIKAKNALVENIKKLDFYLFGDEDNKGKLGMKRNQFLKGLGGGSALGLVGSLFLPTSPWINMLMGGALGIASQNERVKTFLWGTKDKGDNKFKQDGLLGTAKNFLFDNILNPLRDYAKGTFDYVKDFVSNKMVKPFNLAFKPIAVEIGLQTKRMFKSITNFARGAWNAFYEGLEEKTESFFEKVNNTSALGTIKDFTKKVWFNFTDMVKSAITKPFNKLNEIASELRMKHLIQGNGGYMAAGTKYRERLEEYYDAVKNGQWDGGYKMDSYESYIDRARREREAKKAQRELDEKNGIINPFSTKWNVKKEAQKKNVEDVDNLKSDDFLGLQKVTEALTKGKLKDRNSEEIDYQANSEADKLRDKIRNFSEKIASKSSLAIEEVSKSGKASLMERMTASLNLDTKDISKYTAGTFEVLRSIRDHLFKKSGVSGKDLDKITSSEDESMQSKSDASFGINLRNIKDKYAKKVLKHSENTLADERNLRKTIAEKLGIDLEDEESYIDSETGQRVLYSTKDDAVRSSIINRNIDKIKNKLNEKERERYGRRYYENIDWDNPQSAAEVKAEHGGSNRGDLAREDYINQQQNRSTTEKIKDEADRAKNAVKQKAEQVKDAAKNITSGVTQSEYEKAVNSNKPKKEENKDDIENKDDTTTNAVKNNSEDQEHSANKIKEELDEKDALKREEENHDYNKIQAENSTITASIMKDWFGKDGRLLKWMKKAAKWAILLAGAIPLLSRIASLFAKGSSNAVTANGDANSAHQGFADFMQNIQDYGILGGIKNWKNQLNENGYSLTEEFFDIAKQALINPFLGVARKPFNKAVGYTIKQIPDLINATGKFVNRSSYTQAFKNGYKPSRLFTVGRETLDPATVRQMAEEGLKYGTFDATALSKQVVGGSVDNIAEDMYTKIGSSSYDDLVELLTKEMGSNVINKSSKKSLNKLDNFIIKRRARSAASTAVTSNKINSLLLENAEKLAAASSDDAAEAVAKKIYKPGFISNALSNFVSSPTVQTLLGGNKLGKQTLDKISDYASKAALKEVKEKGASTVLSKLGTKLSGLAGDALFFAVDATRGYNETNRMFQLPSGYQPTTAMKASSALSKGISELFLGLIPQQWLAETIYNAFSTEDEQKTLQLQQFNFQKEAADAMGFNISDLYSENDEIRKAAEAQLGLYNRQNNKTAVQKVQDWSNTYGGKVISNTVKTAGSLISPTISGTVAFATGAANTKKAKSALGYEDFTNMGILARAASGFANEIDTLSLGVIKYDKTIEALYGGLLYLKDGVVAIKDGIKDAIDFIVKLPDKLEYWANNWAEAIRGKFAGTTLEPLTQPVINMINGLKDFVTFIHDSITETLQSAARLFGLDKVYNKMVNRSRDEVAKKNLDSINSAIKNSSDADQYQNEMIDMQAKSQLAQQALDNGIASQYNLDSEQQQALINYASQYKEGVDQMSTSDLDQKYGMTGATSAIVNAISGYKDTAKNTVSDKLQLGKFQADYNLAKETITNYDSGKYAKEGTENELDLSKLSNDELKTIQQTMQYRYDLQKAISGNDIQTANNIVNSDIGQTLIQADDQFAKMAENVTNLNNTLDEQTKQMEEQPLVEKIAKRAVGGALLPGILGVVLGEKSPIRKGLVGTINLLTAPIRTALDFVSGGKIKIGPLGGKNKKKTNYDDISDKDKAKGKGNYLLLESMNESIEHGDTVTHDKLDTQIDILGGIKLAVSDAIDVIKGKLTSTNKDKSEVEKAVNKIYTDEEFDKLESQRKDLLQQKKSKEANYRDELTFKDQERQILYAYGADKDVEEKWKQDYDQMVASGKIKGEDFESYRDRQIEEHVNSKWKSYNENYNKEIGELDGYIGNINELTAPNRAAKIDDLEKQKQKAISDRQIAEINLSEIQKATKQSETKIALEQKRNQAANDRLNDYANKYNLDLNSGTSLRDQMLANKSDIGKQLEQAEMDAFNAHGNLMNKLKDDPKAYKQFVANENKLAEKSDVYNRAQALVDERDSQLKDIAKRQNKVTLEASNLYNTKAYKIASGQKKLNSGLTFEENEAAIAQKKMLNDYYSDQISNVKSERKNAKAEFSKNASDLKSVNKRKEDLQKGFNNGSVSIDEYNVWIEKFTQEQKELEEKVRESYNTYKELNKVQTELLDEQKKNNEELKNLDSKAYQDAKKALEKDKEIKTEQEKINNEKKELKDNESKELKEAQKLVEERDKIIKENKDLGGKEAKVYDEANKKKEQLTQEYTNITEEEIKRVEKAQQVTKQSSNAIKAENELIDFRRESTERATSVYEQAIKSAKESETKIDKAITELSDGTSTSVKQAVEQIETTARESENKIENSGDVVSSSVENTGNKIKNESQEASNDIENGTDTITQTIRTGGQNIEDASKNAMNDLEDADDLLNKAIKNLGYDTEERAEQAKKDLTNAKNKVQSAIDALGDKTDATSKKTRAKLENTIKVIDESLENLGDNSKSAVEELQKTLADVSDVMADSITDMGEEAKRAAKNVSNDSSDSSGIGGAAKKIGSKLFLNKNGKISKGKLAIGAAGLTIAAGGLYNSYKNKKNSKDIINNLSDEQINDLISLQAQIDNGEMNYSDLSEEQKTLLSAYNSSIGNGKIMQLASSGALGSTAEDISGTIQDIKDSNSSMGPLGGIITAIGGAGGLISTDFISGLFKRKNKENDEDEDSFDAIDNVVENVTNEISESSKEKLFDKIKNIFGKKAATTAATDALQTGAGEVAKKGIFSKLTGLFGKKAATTAATSVGTGLLSGGGASAASGAAATAGGSGLLATLGPAALAAYVGIQGFKGVMNTNENMGLAEGEDSTVGQKAASAIGNVLTPFMSKETKAKVSQTVHGIGSSISSIFTGKKTKVIDGKNVTIDVNQEKANKEKTNKAYNDTAKKLTDTIVNKAETASSILDEILKNPEEGIDKEKLRTVAIDNVSNGVALLWDGANQLALSQFKSAMGIDTESKITNGLTKVASYAGGLIGAVAGFKRNGIKGAVAGLIPGLGGLINNELDKGKINGDIKESVKTLSEKTQSMWVTKFKQTHAWVDEFAQDSSYIDADVKPEALKIAKDGIKTGVSTLWGAANGVAFQQFKQAMSIDTGTNVAKTVLGVGGAMASGALAGAGIGVFFGGPAGAAIGAGIGAAVGGVAYGIKKLWDKANPKINNDIVKNVQTLSEKTQDMWVNKFTQSFDWINELNDTYISDMQLSDGTYIKDKVLSATKDTIGDAVGLMWAASLETAMKEYKVAFGLDKTANTVNTITKVLSSAGKGAFASAIIGGPVGTAIGAIAGGGIAIYNILVPKVSDTVQKASDHLINGMTDVWANAFNQTIGNEDLTDGWLAELKDLKLEDLTSQNESGETIGLRNQVIDAAKNTIKEAVVTTWSSTLTNIITEYTSSINTLSTENNNPFVTSTIEQNRDMIDATGNHIVWQFLNLVQDKLAWTVGGNISLTKLRNVVDSNGYVTYETYQEPIGDYGDGWLGDLTKEENSIEKMDDGGFKTEVLDSAKKSISQAIKDTWSTTLSNVSTEFSNVIQEQSTDNNKPWLETPIKSAKAQVRTVSGHIVSRMIETMINKLYYTVGSSETVGHLESEYNEDGDTISCTWVQDVDAGSYGDGWLKEIKENSVIDDNSKNTIINALKDSIKTTISDTWDIAQTSVAEQFKAIINQEGTENGGDGHLWWKDTTAIDEASDTIHDIGKKIISNTVTIFVDQLKTSSESINSTNIFDEEHSINEVLTSTKESIRNSLKNSIKEVYEIAVENVNSEISNTIDKDAASEIAIAYSDIDGKGTTGWSKIQEAIRDIARHTFTSGISMLNSSTSIVDNLAELGTNALNESTQASITRTTQLSLGSAIIDTWELSNNVVEQSWKTSVANAIGSFTGGEFGADILPEGVSAEGETPIIDMSSAISSLFQSTANLWVGSLNSLTTYVNEGTTANLFSTGTSLNFSSLTSNAESLDSTISQSVNAGSETSAKNWFSYIETGGAFSTFKKYAFYAKRLAMLPVVVLNGVDKAVSNLSLKTDFDTISNNIDSAMTDIKNSSNTTSNSVKSFLTVNENGNSKFNKFTTSLKILGRIAGLPKVILNNLNTTLGGSFKKLGELATDISDAITKLKNAYNTAKNTGSGGIGATKNSERLISSNMSYGNSSMRNNGCGPIAASLALGSLTGEKINPNLIANFNESRGHVSSDGTYQSFLNDISATSGINSHSINGKDRKSLDKALNKGSKIVALGYGDKNTPYSMNGHYVAINKKSANGKYFVQNPNGSSGYYSWDDISTNTNGNSFYSFDGAGFTGGGNSVRSNAVRWAIDKANDPNVGYEYGGNGPNNYDCSHFVYHAYKDGGGLSSLNYEPTYSMKGEYTNKGFKDVTSSVNLSTGSNLKLGDIVVSPNHTAMISDESSKNLVHASTDRVAKADQVKVRDWYRHSSDGGWNLALRYGNDDGTDSTGSSSSDGIVRNTLFFGDSWMDNSTFRNYFNKNGNNLTQVTGGWQARGFMLRNGQTHTINGNTKTINIDGGLPADKIFVSLGINDSVDPMEKGKSTTSFLQKLRSSYPNTPIHFGKVSKIRAKKLSGYDGSLFNENIDAANSAAQSFANNDSNAYFDDITQGLVDSDGKFKDEYNAGDGVHITAAATKNIWAPNIAKALTSGDSSNASNDSNLSDNPSSTQSTSSSTRLSSYLTSGLSKIFLDMVDPEIKTSSEESSEISTTSTSPTSSTSPTTSTSSKSSGLIGNSNEQKIWNYLTTTAGFTKEQAAGIMGNIKNESGFNPRNLQNSYEKSLGYTDDSYTEAVDNGSYKNFVHDSAGYGLIQWTYHTIKQSLLDFAKSQNKSIGDLQMQLDCLNKDFTSGVYAAAGKKLHAASSIKEATDIMLNQVEKPAVRNLSQRLGYAQEIYNKYASGSGGGNQLINSYKGKDLSKISYAGASMSELGCGPIAASNAIRNITGEIIDPEEIARFTEEQGYVTNGEGANSNFIADLANRTGLNARELNTKGSLDIALDKGQSVIANGISSDSNSPYTSTGHFITISKKLTNGKYLVENTDGTKRYYNWDDIKADFKKNPYDGNYQGTRQFISLSNNGENINSFASSYYGMGPDEWAANNIISKNWDWASPVSERSATNYIALHHTAGDGTPESVHQFHKSKGWAGIGYNYIVSKDGTITEGRGRTKLGAHVKGMNNQSLGISAIGNYDVAQTMPSAQLNAIKQLVYYLKTNYYPDAKIVGHRDIGASDCPGKYYPLTDIQNTWNSDAIKQAVGQGSKVSNSSSNNDSDSNTPTTPTTSSTSTSSSTRLSSYLTSGLSKIFLDMVDPEIKTSSEESSEISKVSKVSNVNNTETNTDTTGIDFPKYNLSESQIRGAANIVGHEQSTRVGKFWEASQMANLTETSKGYSPTPENLVKTLKSGWYAYGTSRYDKGANGSVSIDKDAIDAVKAVLVKGKRVIPRYVDEHDCMSDIASVSPGTKNKRDTWIPHETIIKQTSKVGGGKWTYYGTPQNGDDPFGYTSDSFRTKYGEAHYTYEQANSGFSGGGLSKALNAYTTKSKPTNNYGKFFKSYSGGGYMPATTNVSLNREDPKAKISNDYKAELSKEINKTLSAIKVSKELASKQSNNSNEYMLDQILELLAKIETNTRSTAENTKITAEKTTEIANKEVTPTIIEKNPLKENNTQVNVKNITPNVFNGETSFEDINKFVTEAANAISSGD